MHSPLFAKFRKVLSAVEEEENSTLMTEYADLVLLWTALPPDDPERLIIQEWVSAHLDSLPLNVQTNFYKEMFEGIPDAPFWRRFRLIGNWKSIPLGTFSYAASFTTNESYEPLELQFPGEEHNSRLRSLTVHRRGVFHLPWAYCRKLRDCSFGSYSRTQLWVDESQPIPCFQNVNLTLMMPGYRHPLIDYRCFNKNAEDSPLDEDGVPVLHVENSFVSAHLNNFLRNTPIAGHGQRSIACQIKLKGSTRTFFIEADDFAGIVQNPQHYDLPRQEELIVDSWAFDTLQKALQMFQRYNSLPRAESGRLFLLDGRFCLGFNAHPLKLKQFAPWLKTIVLMPDDKKNELFDTANQIRKACKIAGVTLETPNVDEWHDMVSL